MIKQFVKQNIQIQVKTIQILNLIIFIKSNSYKLQFLKQNQKLPFAQSHMDYQTMQLLIPKKSQQWSNEDISKWLQFINLPNLIHTFKQAGIDGSCVHLLDDDILKNQLNIQSPIIRKKLINWVGFGLEGFNNYIKANLMPSNMLELRKMPTTHLRKQSKSKSKLIKQQPVSRNKYSNSCTGQNINQDEQYLILEQFEGNSLGFHIIKNQILSIGFGKSNDIHSLQTSISQRHALIGKKNGQFFVQDLGSKYGTYIKINHRTVLKNGVILEIGSYQFMVTQINEMAQIIKLKKIYQNLQTQNNENKNILNLNRQSSNVQQKRNFSKGINGAAVPTQKSSGDLLIKQQILIIDLKSKSKFTFGRRKQNDYQRDDKHMSGMHCKITFYNNKFYIQDYGSTNGTWIRISQQMKVSPQIRIQNESYIKLGTAITYVCKISNNSIQKKQKKQKNKIKGKKIADGNFSRQIQDQMGQNQQSQVMIDENLCRVCQKNQNNCLFLPCSHNITCIQCSEGIKKCLQCKHQIGQKLKIHK